MAGLSSLGPGDVSDPSVYVYAVVDVSLSMKGSKLEEVCTQLGDIINLCPDDVLFDITLFSINSGKIMCANKKSINVAQLMQNIVSSCGAHCTHTALFDAWGEVVNAIPQYVLDNNEVQIIVLTDGEDNASKKYTQTSVMDLMNGRITAMTEFKFIQVGQNTNTQLVNSLKTLNKAKQIQTFTTDNTAQGIRTAMQSVSSSIMMSTMRSAKRSPAQKVYRIPTPHPNAAKSSATTNFGGTSTTAFTGPTVTAPPPFLMTTSRRQPGSSSRNTSTQQQTSVKTNPTYTSSSTTSAYKLQ